MQQESPIVAFRNTFKSFGSTKVLDDFAIDIATNEKVAVIGPSGSGKTTLLRILMTLETIDQGTVQVGGDTLWQATLDGKSVLANRKKVREIRSRIGMGFQNFNFFPHM